MQNKPNFTSLLLLSICLFFACTKPAQKPGPAAYVPLLSANFDSVPWKANSFIAFCDSDDIYIRGKNNGIKDTTEIDLTFGISAKPGTYVSKSSFRLMYVYLNNLYIGIPDSLTIISNSNRQIEGTFKVDLYSRFGQAYKKVTKGVFNVKY